MSTPSCEIQEKAAKVVASIDRSRPNATVFLRDTGDPSRYHETVALRCAAGAWSLNEDYLTPEYSLHRSTPLPGFSREDAQVRLEMLFTLNPVLLSTSAACPKEGLLVPDQGRYIAP